MIKKQADETNINSHIVTRGLTKPWETKYRNLIYYNFPTNKIEKHSSRSLFSKHGLLTDKEEQIANTQVEDPLIKIRDKFIKNRNAKLKQKEWEALALYGFFQMHRFSMSRGPINNELPLSDFLLADTDKKSLADGMYQHCSLLHLYLKPNKYFFFPENGVILLPTKIKISDKYHPNDAIRIWNKMILAIPFSPTWLFIICPKIMKKSLNFKKPSITKLFIHLSIGCGGEINKVVIPPKFYEKFRNKENKLKQFICDYRKQAREGVDLYYNFINLKNLSIN